MTRRFFPILSQELDEDDRLYDEELMTFEFLDFIHTPRRTVYIARRLFDLAVDLSPDEKELASNLAVARGFRGDVGLEVEEQDLVAAAWLISRKDLRRAAA